MVVIPSGAFWMGSRESEPGSRDSERPRHNVNVDAFAIGKYEVTFDEWDACVDAGGCEHRPDDRGWGRGKLPVMKVSWEDAQQYAAWLSRETGETYRLPSEAEWEYAARAFPTSQGQNAPAYAFGDRITEEQANFGRNVGRTTAVGSYPANAWGLHDMHGNVWEWVDDRWDDDYDARTRRLREEREREIRGQSPAPDENIFRVMRGGSWIDDPELLRSAVRAWGQPADRILYDGFRLARTLTP
jgi:formylglycine-generating enzyme required for sulfatase activity